MRHPRPEAWRLPHELIPQKSIPGYREYHMINLTPLGHNVSLLPHVGEALQKPRKYMEVTST